MHAVEDAVAESRSVTATVRVCLSGAKAARHTPNIRQGSLLSTTSSPVNVRIPGSVYLSLESLLHRAWSSSTSYSPWSLVPRLRRHGRGFQRAGSNLFGLPMFLNRKPEHRQPQTHHQQPSLTANKKVTCIIAQQKYQAYVFYAQTFIQNNKIIYMKSFGFCFKTSIFNLKPNKHGTLVFFTYFYFMRQI